MRPGEPPAPSPRPAEHARAEIPAPPGIEASTGALVVELSQLELALRRWQREQGRGHPPGGLDFRDLMRRKDAILRDLRERGLPFDEPVPDPAPAGEADAVPGCPTGHDQLAGRRGAGESQAVADLQRALVTRSVIGQAMGIMMERHHLVADAAFEMLGHASSVTNRKLADVAAELTVTGVLPGSRRS